MTTYYTNDYKDAFVVMEQALQEAGFERVKRAGFADIAFLDHEPSGNIYNPAIAKRRLRFDRLAKSIPVFLYPHTPYATYLWDGYVFPSESVACNFVPTQAFIKSMEAYHYPCRMEEVGFTRPLKVKPFKPTSGKHLAFSSVRLTGSKGVWVYPDDLRLRNRTMEWILDNRSAFEKVTIFYTFSIENAALQSYQKYSDVLDFVCVASDSLSVKRMGTQSAIEQLKGVDLFLGCNTLGYISISQGIPTILIGHDNEFPLHSSNCGEHYADYEKYVGFPLQLHKMTAEQALEICHKPNPKIEQWKELNIGRSFDAKRFMEVVREYL